MKLSKQDIERFWSHVDIRGENECWLWKASKKPNGYGEFSVRRRHLLAHRVSWVISNGRDPREGFDIAHAPVICHNRACCNPAHLSEKTAKENANDRATDGTQRYGDQHPNRLHPEQFRNERNGNAKLTQRDVDQIRELRKQGLVLGAIGARFGVGISQVFRIVRGEHWRPRP